MLIEFLAIRRLLNPNGSVYYNYYYYYLYCRRTVFHICIKGVESNKKKLQDIPDMYS
jgi:hypothetical protein